MVINLRLLLAVALGTLALSATDPLLAAAVLGALLVLVAVTHASPRRMLLSTTEPPQPAYARVPLAPQTRPAGPGRPQPRAPDARSCASS